MQHRGKNVGLNPIAHSTLMFTRSSFNSIGAYRAKIEKSEDFDLVLRLSRVGQLASVNLPVGELYFGVPGSHTVRHQPKGMGSLHFVFLSLIDNYYDLNKIDSSVDIQLFLEKLTEENLFALQTKLVFMEFFREFHLSWIIKKIFFYIISKNIFHVIRNFNTILFGKSKDLKSLIKFIENEIIIYKKGLK